MTVNLSDLINNTIIVGEETKKKSIDWWVPPEKNKTRVKNHNSLQKRRLNRRL